MNLDSMTSRERYDLQIAKQRLNYAVAYQPRTPAQRLADIEEAKNQAVEMIVAMRVDAIPEPTIPRRREIPAKETLQQINTPDQCRQRKETIQQAAAAASREQRDNALKRTQPPAPDPNASLFAGKESTTPPPREVKRITRNRCSFEHLQISIEGT